MKPIDENVPAPRRRPQSPVQTILFLAAILGLAWFAAMPATLGAADPWRFMLVVVISVVAVATWGVFTAKERNLLVGQAEEERDLFFSLSLDIFGMLDATGHFQRLNPALVNTLGLKPENIEGMALIDIVHADDRSIVRQGLNSLAGGQAAQFEVRCRCGDGSYRWLSWNATPLPKESRVYVVAHDVTDRKISEDALRSESAFRKAMEDSVLTGLRAVDMKGRIIYVNRAFCELVGYDMGDLIGREPPFPYWADANDAKAPQWVEPERSGQTPAEGIELRIRRRDGKLRYVRMHVSPLVNADGIQTGWMTAMADITEQHRASNDLQAANERITAVLEGLDAAVYVADAATSTLLYSNRAYEAQMRLAGDTGNLGVPQPEWGDYPVDPRRLLAHDVPRELFDGELQHPQTGQWFHLRERALRWVDGRIVRLGVATDISTMKRAEDLTREQEERLAQTSRLITMGEMASTLAHELNQPLSAISNYSMGCVNRLKSGNFRPEDLLGAMEKASAQAVRAGNIVRHIRDFVRKSEPRQRLVRIEQIIEDAIGIAGIEAKRLGAHIIVSIPPDLPPVMADRIMIEQVLMNLIKNGAEAMHEKPIHERRIDITAEIHEDLVQINVSDFGTGINQLIVDHLFSPFFTTKKDGMGMGLNICRSIIEFHKGRLWVDPNPTGGSIFRFTLPQETSLESDITQ